VPRVVVDTNVWISALLVPESRPGRVVREVRRGRVTIVGSWELAEELVGVLRRPKFTRYAVSEDAVEELLVFLGALLPSVDIEVAMRDPNDAPVVAAALAGHAEAIVTGDRGLLEDTELRAWLGERGVEVISPATLLDRLG
jgi:putative PIN family toxin of toxin-antitoxin system